MLEGAVTAVCAVDIQLWGFFKTRSRLKLQAEWLLQGMIMAVFLRSSVLFLLFEVAY